MEDTSKAMAERELLEAVKEAVVAKMPKGPGEAGCKTLEDPMHRRWKMSVNDAPVIAK